jgi:hypothetical protein
MHIKRNKISNGLRKSEGKIFLNSNRQISLKAEVMDVEKMRRKNHLYNINQGLIIEVIEQMQRISNLNFSLANQTSTSK